MFQMIVMNPVLLTFIVATISSAAILIVDRLLVKTDKTSKNERALDTKELIYRLEQENNLNNQR